MYATIFEKVQALLSRTFWLGNFFPVFIFALVNLGVAWMGVDGFAGWLTRKWPEAMVLSAFPALGLISVGILSFVLAPLIPAFRAALEGRFLPDGIQEQLKAEFRRAAEHIQIDVNNAKENYVFFDQTNARARSDFENARNDTNARADLSRDSFEAAKRAFDEFIAEVSARRTNRTYSAYVPVRNKVIDAVNKLTVALRQYPMQPNNNPVPDIADALDQMQRDLQDELQFTKEIADRNLQQAQAEFRTSFVPTDIRPTRIGNSRAAMEQYPSVAYFADFDFLWPRLRMVISEDETIFSAVEMASAQLDFAVLMTVLAVATAVTWLIVLPLLGSSIVVYFFVGIVLPALIPFFYWLVGETQQAFGGVMEMAVDGLRFRLLAALRQPLPSSLEAEQRTWRELQIALYSGLGTEVRFRHPKS